MKREADIITIEKDLQRSQELIETISTLKKLNKQLLDRLQASKKRIKSPEANLNASMCRANSTLRNARENIAQVMKVMEKYVVK